MKDICTHDAAQHTDGAYSIVLGSETGAFIQFDEVDGEPIRVLIAPNAWSDAVEIGISYQCVPRLLGWVAGVSVPGDGLWARFRRWLIMWIGGGR